MKKILTKLILLWSLNGCASYYHPMHYQTPGGIPIRVDGWLKDHSPNLKYIDHKLDEIKICLGTKINKQGSMPTQNLI